MSRPIVLMLVAAAAAMAGCATLFGKHTKDLSLNSNPAGAEVYVNGNRVGVTPLTYQVPNNKAVNVTFKLDGHKDMTCNLTTSTGGGWVVLDILGGLVPVIIDAATGDWSQLTSNACNVTLDPVPTTATAPVTPAAPTPAPVGAR